jgi:hypothetical protein
MHARSREFNYIIKGINPRLTISWLIKKSNQNTIHNFIPHTHRCLSETKMYQNWIQRSENTLKQLRELMENPDQDRLELVRVMRFSFGTLNQSLHGWMQWVSTPEIMSNFTKEELEEMAKKIAGIVEQFITYDIETANTGILKGLDKQEENEQNGTQFVS